MKNAVWFDDKKEALVRILFGIFMGMMAYLFLSWLAQPGSLFGGSMGVAFTFCFNSNVPETLGAVLGFLLWGTFGALAGVASLPFADGGQKVLLRSLCHFTLMALTLWAWVILNFSYEPLPGLMLTFLLPYALIYLLIWLGRWVGWYAEVAELRQKLGLAPGPSFLKWKETLPHMAFALLLCLVVPLALRLCDAPDVPVLSGFFYPWLLLPLGGFFSALSLGRRQGFCPLYPAACLGAILLFILLARLCSNMDDWPLVPIALASTLFGNALGAKNRARKKSGGTGC